MNWTKLFPTILIALMAVSGIICFIEGDVRKGLYWIFAACLNATVTY